MPPPNDFGGHSRANSFYETLTAAINDMADRGYQSMERVAYWVERLRESAIRSMVSFKVLQEALQRTLRATYHKLVERFGILRYHPGVSRFTLQRVAPRMRAELDRRILASANLIKINRDEAISTTLRRFSGWATSIPPGGTEALKRAETKAEIRKPLASLPYRERLVASDQGHKFASNLNEILATDAGAIAATWHSHWRQANYDYRPDHKERDEKVYLVRGSWAQDKGLVKVGADGYTDQITKPGEEVNCRCFYGFLYSLNRIPDDMLTAKGRQSLAEAKEVLAA